MLTAIGSEKFYGEHIRSGLSRDDRRTFATLPMATWSAGKTVFATTSAQSITAAICQALVVRTLLRLDTTTCTGARR